MKKLALVLALLLSGNAWASSARTLSGDVAEGLGNALVNPSFERATATQGWTVTTATTTTFTSTMQDGKQSVRLNYGSSAGDIAQSVVPTYDTNGINMEASCWVNTTLTTMQVCALSGGTEILCQNVPSTGTWQRVSTNFVGPSNGTSVGVRVKTTSSSTIGNPYVDHCYVGPATNLAQVSQAQLMGTAVVTGCAANWSNSSLSFASLGTQSGCSYAVTGQAQAPATNVAGFKFASLPPGEYVIQYEGFIGSGGFAGSNNAVFQFTDGTNTARESSAWASVSSSEGLGSTINQSITYTTAQSNVTLQIFGKVNNASNSALVGGTSSFPGTFKLYYFPSQSQLAVKPDQTPASWSGYSNSISGGCSTTSATYADPSACTGIAVTQTTSRNVVCSQSGTGPAISCTLPRSGTWTVCAYPVLSGSASTNASVRLLDSTNSFTMNPGTTSTPAGTGYFGIPTCGKENVPAAGATVFKLQMAASGGTTLSILNGAASGSAAIQWTVDEGDAPMPAPYLTGSVQNGSSAATSRHFWGKFGGASEGANCTGTCTVFRQDSSLSVSSVTRNSTGNYTLNIPSGACSAPPTCTFGGFSWGTSQTSCENVSTPTTTTMTLNCYNLSASAALDSEVSFVCDCMH